MGLDRREGEEKSKAKAQMGAAYQQLEVRGEESIYIYKILSNWPTIQPSDQ